MSDWETDDFTDEISTQSLQESLRERLARSDLLGDSEVGTIADGRRIPRYPSPVRNYKTEWEERGFILDSRPEIPEHDLERLHLFSRLFESIVEPELYPHRPAAQMMVSKLTVRARLNIGLGGSRRSVDEQFPTYISLKSTLFSKWLGVDPNEHDWEFFSLQQFDLFDQANEAFAR